MNTESVKRPAASIEELLPRQRGAVRPVAVSTGFRRLTVITAIAIYLLMVMGGVVRVTGSGLGCPDWPTCYGRLIPPPELTAIVEYSHRSIATIAGVLIFITVGIAWLRYRHLPWVVGPAAGMIGLLAVQVPLGALVVDTELEAALVAFHLGMALLILAYALTLAVSAHKGGRVAVERRRRWLWITIGLLFVVLLSGAVVVGTRASLACPDWPLCHGGIVPPPNASPLIAIHLLHRYGVAVVSLLIGVTVWRALKSDDRGSRHWGVALGGILVAQIVIGALQVVLQIPPLWRALHLSMGSAAWAALIVLVTRESLSGRRLDLPV